MKHPVSQAITSKKGRDGKGPQYTMYNICLKKKKKKASNAVFFNLLLCQIEKFKL